MLRNKLEIQKNFPLSKFTTIAIGGYARNFVKIKNEKKLISAIEWAKENGFPKYVIGAGSNIIVSDNGYRGVIVQNQIQKFVRQKNVVTVGAGNNLLKFIEKLNFLGLAGLERMAGIPGTIGGAIYGCAGAYGQEIKDTLISVRVFDGKKFRTLTKSQCQFGYRESIFKKKKKWVILEAVFRFRVGESGELAKISRKIIRLREKKYKPGLKCPGSFFKNIRLADLSATAQSRFLKRVPKDKIIYNKVPAGYLLEAVGAKGMKQGKIRIANHHANLLYNSRGGLARDVKKLANRLRALVKKKFGITIEEEVQYL